MPLSEAERNQLQLLLSEAAEHDEGLFESDAEEFSSVTHDELVTGAMTAPPSKRLAQTSQAGYSGSPAHVP